MTSLLLELGTAPGGAPAPVKELSGVNYLNSWEQRPIDPAHARYIAWEQVGTQVINNIYILTDRARYINAESPLPKHQREYLLILLINTAYSLYIRDFNNMNPGIIGRIQKELKEITEFYNS